MTGTDNSENEKKNSDKENADLFENSTRSIPVIEEFLNVEKKVIETGKVYISKKIEKEKATLNIPLKGEEFEVKRVPVRTKLLDEPPSSFYEDGKMIIPIVRQVAKVIIKYEVAEEIHILRHPIEAVHHEEITLLKEKAEIHRKDS